MNIMQSFSFIPLMASEKKIFYYFFKHLDFRLPWQPIKISDLGKIHMVGKGLFQKHFCKTFFQNISSNTNKCQFPLFPWKLISCHSNESTWEMKIKNIIYVETNVMNMYAKFQLHPP